MRTATMIGLLMTSLLYVGCMNLGGGRQAISLPFSAPNFAMDSVGVQQKNDDAAGMQVSGEAANPTADQQMTFSGDATNTRSTDASLADDQSQAQGKQSGNQTDSGTKTLDKSLTPTANIGPAGGAQVGVGDAPVATPPVTQ